MINLEKLQQPEQPRRKTKEETCNPPNKTKIKNNK
jgi:hypothetical protein